MKQIEFCGAFNGTVALRRGEALEHAAQRIQDAMQRVLDAHAKRLNVAIGVDFGEIHIKDEA